MLQWFIRFPEFAEFTEFNDSFVPFRKNSIVSPIAVVLVNNIKWQVC